MRGIRKLTRTLSLSSRDAATRLEVRCMRPWIIDLLHNGFRVPLGAQAVICHEENAFASIISLMARIKKAMIIHFGLENNPPISAVVFAGVRYSM